MENHGIMKKSIIQFAVCGLHMRGFPLVWQLEEREGRFLRTEKTAPEYRLFELNTKPAKPGLLRTAKGGKAIEIEIWEMPAAGFGDFVDSIPSPLGFGKITLCSGKEITGFLCEASACDGASDITEYGGWRAWQSRNR